MGEPSGRTSPGYPPPSGYSLPGRFPTVPGDYMPLGNRSPPNAAAGHPPPGDTIMHQPTAAAGYPPPGSEYPALDNKTVAPYGNWIPPRTGLLCPPGLEYLTMIDEYLVKPKPEVLLSCDSSNYYKIKNSLGQKIYTAQEVTAWCPRNFLGPCRAFDFRVVDNAGNVVMHLNRPCRCDACCCPCCLQQLEVTAPPGTVVGYVIQEWSILGNNFRLENAAKETVLRIERRCCACTPGGDIEFRILSVDGSVEVGKITKPFPPGRFVDVGPFTVTFPMDLDVNMKAVMLGASILIDFMFFEKPKICLEEDTLD